MDVKTITLPKVYLLISEFSILSLAFLIPFFVSGPQLLTGTLVNALLFLYAMKSYRKKTSFLVVAPSIGALLNGILLGKFTIYLLYFLPFVWLGNYVLIYFFNLMRKKSGMAVSVIVSSLLKCATLFLVAFLLVSTKAVPGVFLQMMGIFQLYTAVMGGVIAVMIHNLFLRKI